MDNRIALKKITAHDGSIMYSLPNIKNKRALVLAPHPDDETLGCGGTIINLKEKGIQIKIILITDGSAGGRSENISDIRLREFGKAQEILRCDNKNYLGVKDGTLNEFSDNVKVKISKIIKSFNPDIIFVPYIFDHSPDHHAAATILADCLEYKDNAIIAMYEIWTPILYPNCYLNISQVFDRKLLAARCYQSQEQYYRIVEKVTSLNRFRASLSMRKNIKYAEAFKCFSSFDYKDIIDRFREQLV